MKLQVTEELKIERLRMEHAEIDVKIAAIQQRIAQDEKEGVELDRQLLNATEMEKQSVVSRFAAPDIFVTNNLFIKALP